MKIEIFSHCNGDNIVDKKIKSQLLKVLEESNFKIKEGCANELRKEILTILKSHGWSDDFMLDANSQISLTSYIDEHILCFQTGNMSRFYADLLKIQYVFEKKKAKVAIYIIPSKEAAKIMGSNIANFERFTFELNLFKEIITIPTIVIGIN
jgi:hypothetical protein